MATLREMRDELVSMDDPGKVLRLADMYLTDMKAKGGDFLLPQNHIFIKPILEHYYNDLPGWRKFVLGVRDILLNARLDYRPTQALYRTLDVRLTQQERRDRLNSAVEMAVLTGKIGDVPAEKLRYAKRCTQEWMKQRTMVLNAAREKTGNRRVSREEQETILSDFWAGVDNKIANGELPEA